MTNRFYKHVESRGDKQAVTEIDLARVGDVYYDSPNRIYVYVYGREIRLDVDAEEFVQAWKSYHE